MEKQDKQPKTSNTDSLFGIALAQAFMGAVFGLAVDTGWEATEIASTVYEDRKPPSFTLGQKNSLTGIFANGGQDWKDILMPRPAPAPAHRPSFGF
jgi:hypothetical protein